MRDGVLVAERVHRDPGGPLGVVHRLARRTARRRVRVVQRQRRGVDRVAVLGGRLELLRHLPVQRHAAGDADVVVHHAAQQRMGEGVPPGTDLGEDPSAHRLLQVAEHVERVAADHPGELGHGELPPDHGRHGQKLAAPAADVA